MHTLNVISGAEFSATQLEVSPKEEAKAIFAELYGSGAVSVTLPKSKAIDLDRFISQKLAN